MELLNILEAIGDCRRVLILGDMDTGKTFMARSLIQTYRTRGEKVIHADLDMGQSTIGPPTTVGLVAPGGTRYLYFVGNITPYGVFREIERGINQLRTVLDSIEHHRVVIDTPGLVKDRFAWSLAKVEAKQMQADFAILLDRKGETDHIAAMFQGFGLPFLKSSPLTAVRKKTYVKRNLYRTELFLDYFREASLVRVELQGRKIIHLGKRAEPGLLVGLCNEHGFLVALALLVDIESEAIIVSGHVPSLQQVAIIKFGRYSIG